MSIFNYPPQNGVLTSLIWRKTATGGETSLSGYDNASQALSYTPGQEQVYLNGILLVRGDDYTATNGTSITGLAALAANDFVQINCYNNFSIATLPASSLTGLVTNAQIDSLATSKLTGTIANNQLANSAITVNGSAISLGGSVNIATGGMTLLSSTPLTGASTINLTSINQGYNRLYLYMDRFHSASPSSFAFSMNNQTNIQYWYRMVNTNGSIQHGAQAGAVDCGFSIFNGTGSYADGAVAASFAIEIENYTSSIGEKQFKMYGAGIWAPSTNWASSFIVGNYRGVSPITSISLTMSSNFTAGTAYLYGVK